MSLRAKLARNLGASLANLGVTFVIQIATTPVFLIAWGPSDFGTWLTVSSVAAILVLGDMGLSGVVANQIVMSSRDRDWIRAAAVLSAGSKFAVLGHLALLVAVCTGAVLSLSMGWTAGNIATDHLLFLICGWSIYYLLGFYITSLGGVLRAVDKFVYASYLSTAIRLLEFVLMVAALLTFGTFEHVLLAAVTMRLLGVVYLILDCRRSALQITEKYHPLVVPSVMLRAGSLLLPGIATVLIQLSSTLSSNVPVILIGAVLGPIGVATFVASRTLARMAMQCGAVISLATNPEFTELLHDQQIERAARVLHVSMFFLLVFGVSVTLIAYFVGRPVFEVWTAGHLEVTPALLGILAASGAIGGMQSVVLGFVQSTNRHASLAARTCIVTLFGVSALFAIPISSVEQVAGLVLVLDSAVLAITILAATRILEVEPSQFLRSTIRDGVTEMRRTLLTR